MSNLPPIEPSGCPPDGVNFLQELNNLKSFLLGFILSESGLSPESCEMTVLPSEDWYPVEQLTHQGEVLATFQIEQEDERLKLTCESKYLQSMKVCPAGHVNPDQDTFCLTCGLPVEPVGDLFPWEDEEE